MSVQPLLQQLKFILPILDIQLCRFMIFINTSTSLDAKESLAKSLEKVMAQHKIIVLQVFKKPPDCKQKMFDDMVLKHHKNQIFQQLHLEHDLMLHSLKF